MSGKRIFFSYGHDCIDIVSKIKKAFEENGYSVWLDKTDIEYGEEWRSKITEGIVDSDFVFAFLSKYSLRKESVCLNELMIAVGYKYEYIRTILLEEDIEELIPASINGIQFLDLSEWRSMDLNSAEFNNWFNNQLPKLISLTDDSIAQKTNTQLQYLMQLLNPELLSSRFVLELQKPFIKRTHFDTKISQWLEKENEPPFFLLYGNPGTGKSAFAAHYLHFDYRVAAVVFCEWGKKKYVNADRIIKTMAYAIASKISSYRVRLSYILEKYAKSLDELGIYDLLDLLIIKPFTSDIISHNGNILIIIDGLDEANRDGCNELAEVLSQYRDQLPFFVKFLITARKDAIIERHFDGNPEFIIDSETLLNQANIRDYFRQELHSIFTKMTKVEESRLLDELIARSENSFLYADLLIKSVKSTDSSLLEISNMPSGINSVYFNWMHRLFPNEKEFEENYYDLLSVLVALPMPVPEVFLVKLLNITQRKFNKKIRVLKQFLYISKNHFGESTISIFHDSFKNWLTSGSADIYQVDEENGIEIVGAAINKSFRENYLSDFEIENVSYLLAFSGYDQLYYEIISNELFLQRMLLLGEKYEKSNFGYGNALKLYEQFLEATKNIQNDQMKEIIQFKILRCHFSLGNYYSCKNELIKIIDDDSPKKDTEMYLESIAMLASICDWEGNREKAIQLFSELINRAKEIGAERFIFRGYAGLIWNDHFNQLGEAEKLLSEISNYVYTHDEMIMYDLFSARIMQSNGAIEEALLLYRKVYSNYSFDEMHDCYTYHKIMMLLLEILPCCFDNNHFLDGVNYGTEIMKKVRGNSWLEECYCAAWTAFNYLFLGDFDKAEHLLAHAIVLNHSFDDVENSLWMKMNNTSIEGFLKYEKGDFSGAIDCHKKVRNYALECSDGWMSGDALFEILKIRLLFMNNTDGDDLSEIKELANSLEQIATETDLPHLKLKAYMINALICTKDGDKNKAYVFLSRAKDISEDYSLASIQAVEMYYIESKVYKNYNDIDAYSAVREKIKKTVNEIDLNNQSKSIGLKVSYIKKPIIRLIMERIDD